MKVLFATPEISDFVQVGGLAAVSAALPRALRSLSDIRVIVPGYPGVLSQINAFEKIGETPAHASLPPCEVGLGRTVDGLPVYAVMNAGLFDRPGTPYGSHQASRTTARIQ